MPEVFGREFLNSGDIGVTQINPLHGVAMAEMAGVRQSFVVLMRQVPFRIMEGIIQLFHCARTDDYRGDTPVKQQPSQGELREVFVSFI